MKNLNESIVLDQVHAQIGVDLCQRIGAPRYDLWFRDKTKFTLKGDRLIVGVPNHFCLEWLQKKFAADIRVVAEVRLGAIEKLDFTIDPELFQAERRKQESGAPSGNRPAAVTTVAAPSEPAVALRPRLRRWRRLEDFVVGSCNRVAHASALSVVEQPGEAPMPLVLHGPVGSGKSHLLEGVHAGLKERFPDARIVFLTAEEFTNRFVAAVHAGKQPSFRKQFRDCDVLLIDDLHFLARKTATQEEFLHTLESLQREGRQVVLTCDCHPRLAEIFLPELTDRLAGGAVWGLAWPDDVTRRAIIEVKSRGGASLPSDVCQFLSESLRGNVRELEGAIHTLVHLSRVTGQPVTLELAREALAEVLRASVRHVELADIDQAVVEALALPPGVLQSRQRRLNVSAPRMLAMYLARKLTKATYSEVGHYFGKRNHSTAVAAEKKVRAWIASNESLLLGARKMPVRAVLDLVEAALAR